MTRPQVVNFFRAIPLVAIAMVLSSVSAAESMNTPASTPAGIMLVEVHREEGFSSDQYFWTRLGDADGATLFYTIDQKEISLENFKPAKANETAVAFDDWSIVPNGNIRQWAYQSHPLFTWDLEQEAGQIATNMALYGPGPNGEVPLSERREGILLPPEGWQVAIYTPTETVDLPDGFDVQVVESGQGVVLTDFEGFSLYGAFDHASCQSNDCYKEWTPMAAPALAIGWGEFSIFERIDGSRQWAYRDQPLFRYKGDLLPGDAHGRDKHDQLRLALLKENFTPEGVKVAAQTGYGDILTLHDQTLYFGSAFEKYWGGRNLRGSFEIAYFKGKRLGGDACLSDKCLSIWKPFVASADATARGFWEVITRHDGTRQWAYKGFALYTNSEDKSAGQMRGHSLYDIADVDGDEQAISRTKYLAEVGNALGGAGIYWSVAKP